jgi:hypothetical protein
MPDDVVTIIKLLNEHYNVKETDGEIGIEIEVEGDNLYKGKLKSWRVEHDGSLRGNDNAEYVLRNPIPRTDIKKVLSELSKALEANNSEVDNNSPRTSVHIHINCQRLTPLKGSVFISCLIPPTNYEVCSVS